MNCIKCGKDTKSEQVFCQQCLQVMDKYPVRPDVHIQLPSRPINTPQKRSHKWRLLASADEQIAVLRKRIRRLVALVVILALLLVVAIVGIFHVNMANKILSLAAPYTSSNVVE